MIHGSVTSGREGSECLSGRFFMGQMFVKIVWTPYATADMGSLCVVRQSRFEEPVSLC